MPALSGRPLRALSEFAHAEFSFPRPDVVSAEIGANVMFPPDCVR